jgi:hypothetical protein
MWCDACRSVGTIHCAHPDECGYMLSNKAAAENWNAWLDDLPIGAEFHPAIDRLQDFIAGLAALEPSVQRDAAAIREAALVAALKECAEGLAAYVNAEFPIVLRDEYPTFEAQYARDMGPVTKALALIDNPRKEVI